MGIELPPGFNYWAWFREPAALKWYALEFVPILRFVPIVLALIVGAIVQALLWRITYRIGAVIFLSQVFLDLAAMMLLSVVFSIGILVYEKVFPDPSGRRELLQELQERKRQEDVKTLHDVAARVRHLEPGTGSFWRRANADWEAANQRLQPLYRALGPLTRHLPLPAQDFLESGGWVLTLAGMGVLGLLWPRIHRKRKRHGARRQRPLLTHHDEDKDDLALIGDALTALGPRQATVKGKPARLRLVVMAPTIADAMKLPAEAVLHVLDGMVHGLGEITKFDMPRTEIWTDVQTHEGFRRKLSKHIVFPKDESQASHWALVFGETATVKTPVFVGLALYTKEPTKLGTVEAPPGQWRTVLGIRAVPEEERVRS
jgi:hypothetical protein